MHTEAWVAVRANAAEGSPVACALRVLTLAKNHKCSADPKHAHPLIVDHAAGRRCFRDVARACVCLCVWWGGGAQAPCLSRRLKTLTAAVGFLRLDNFQFRVVDSRENCFKGAGAAALLPQLLLAAFAACAALFVAQ